MNQHALISDVFPAEVTLPNGRVEQRARAFITDRGVIVLAMRNGDRPTVVFRDFHSEPPELPDRGVSRLRSRTVVHTAQGDVLARVAGCTCGSKLRALSLNDVDQLDHE